MQQPSLDVGDVERTVLDDGLDIGPVLRPVERDLEDGEVLGRQKRKRVLRALRIEEEVSFDTAGHVVEELVVESEEEINVGVVPQPPPACNWRRFICPGFGDDIEGPQDVEDLGRACRRKEDVDVDLGRSPWASVVGEGQRPAEGMGYVRIVERPVEFYDLVD